MIRSCSTCINGRAWSDPKNCLRCIVGSQWCSRIKEEKKVNQIVEVKFRGDPFKNYAFKNDLEGIIAGDYVVCDTSRGYSTGEVVGVYSEDCTMAPKATKWVVQKVDLEKHLYRLEMEKRKAELEKKKIDLLKKMDARAKKVKSISFYEELAVEDEIMRELVNEFKVLVSDGSVNYGK